MADRSSTGVRATALLVGVCSLVMGALAVGPAAAADDADAGSPAAQRSGTALVVAVHDFGPPVVWGSTGEFGADLLAFDGADLTGREVTATQGGSALTTAVDERGHASVTLTLTRSGPVGWSFAGDDTHEPSTAEADWVAVMPDLAVTLPARVRRGERVQVRGRVLPAGARRVGVFRGTPPALPGQPPVEGRVARRIGWTTTAPDGTFAWSSRPLRRLGPVQLYVRARGGAGLTWTVSEAHRVVVRPRR